MVMNMTVAEQLLGQLTPEQQAKLEQLKSDPDFINFVQTSVAEAIEVYGEVDDFGLLDRELTPEEIVRLADEGEADLVTLDEMNRELDQIIVELDAEIAAGKQERVTALW